MDVLDKKANDRSMVLRDMPKCMYSYYSDNQQHNHHLNNSMSRSAMLLPMLFIVKNILIRPLRSIYLNGKGKAFDLWCVGISVTSPPNCVRVGLHKVTVSDRFSFSAFII